MLDTKPFPHGTLSGYKKKCRCDLCKKASHDSYQRYAARLKAERAANALIAPEEAENPSLVLWATLTPTEVEIACDRILSLMTGKVTVGAPEAFQQVLLGLLSQRPS